jgi:ATP-dependent DNA helicase RecQ
MEVVIVGKTHMYGGRWCIGALTLNVWASIRLVQQTQDNGWPSNVEFQVGQIWNVEGAKPKNLRPPHTENFLVRKREYVRDYGKSLARDIVARVPIASGGVEALYEGCLRAIPSGSLRIIEGCVPSFSTQFWIPNQNLEFRERYYWLGNRKIKFVGEQTPSSIQRGSLVRMSLSGWFRPEGHTQDGCFLQISGWWPPQGCLC